MSDPGRSVRASTLRAIATAGRFLTERQDPDGYWRDYNLEPGRSEAWITGCVGYALCLHDHVPQPWRVAIDRAAAALLASRRPSGWGYNRRTACDADSTSWAVRFLVRADAFDDLRGASLLGPYVTSTGAVRTFDTPERFGSWAMQHDEVTPVAGLALLATGEHQLAGQLRASVLKSWVAGYGWSPFWWNTGAYVSAQSLEFLAASGGIPEELAVDERARLLQAGAPGSAFEAAQQLVAAVHLGLAREVLHAGNHLLGLQADDGGWPPSPALLVPSQRNPSQSHVGVDDRRLLSTALAVVALTRWLQSRDRSNGAVPS